MADVRPLCIDLCCGDFGGWAEGFLAEGFDVVGFDIAHNPWSCYPGQLIVQDILTVHGSQCKDATVIVASPPCQKYSYMAMPWKRAKSLAKWYRENSDGVADLNALFNACFRIQREASEAAGHHIPLIVENVKGAEPWVGRAGWHFGSFYLWGDVPALMPVTKNPKIVEGHVNIRDGHSHAKHLTNPSEHTKNNGGSWFNIAHNTASGLGRNPDGRKQQGSGREWFAGEGKISRVTSSRSPQRKIASAMIAKIPFPLARHIAWCFKPLDEAEKR